MQPYADLLATQPAPAERADAARNRAKIHAAAARLFAAGDPRTITMDDIAKAAGVGRGTLYRRYPDVRSIAVALLNEHEQELQEQLLRGAPPLGPGAPPAQRLHAFYAAMVQLLEAHAPLALGAETGGERFTTGAYGFWVAHVRALLRAHGVADPDALADILLAPLAAEVYQYQRSNGITPDRIVAALDGLAVGLLGNDQD
jgi:AcrR family transcriptional regulator